MIASRARVPRSVRILVAVDPDHPRPRRKKPIGAPLRHPRTALRSLLRKQRLVSTPVEHRRGKKSGGTPANGGDERTA